MGTSLFWYNLIYMADPKMGEKNGQPHHYSVGAVIKKGDKYFLIDRTNPPFGFASVAGHVDEGETPEEALVREVKEESGFDVTESKLLIEEYVSQNRCVKNVNSHHWYVYKVEVVGEVVHDITEAKSIGWYTRDEIAGLKLEPIWEVWFKKLGII